MFLVPAEVLACGPPGRRAQPAGGRYLGTQRCHTVALRYGAAGSEGCCESLLVGSYSAAHKRPKTDVIQ